MAKIYLDTSALAKRYVQEKGTEILDLTFNQASPEHPLVFSFWNIGESLGVYDKYLSRKHLTQNQLRTIIQRMFKEFGQLVARRTLIIVPLNPQVIVSSWRYILDQHLYAADAIQIASFRLERCDFLLSADKRFLDICKHVGLESYNVEHKEDRAKIQKRLSGIC